MSSWITLALSKEHRYYIFGHITGTSEMSQFSPVLGRTSIRDLKYSFPKSSSQWAGTWQCWIFHTSEQRKHGQESPKSEKKGFKFYQSLRLQTFKLEHLHCWAHQAWSMYTVFNPISAQGTKINYFGWTLICFNICYKDQPKMDDFAHFLGDSQSYWIQNE